MCILRSGLHTLHVSLEYLRVQPAMHTSRGWRGVQAGGQGCDRPNGGSVGRPKIRVSVTAGDIMDEYFRYFASLLHLLHILSRVIIDVRQRCAVFFLGLFD